MSIIEEYSRLSPTEEEELAKYKGNRYELCDGKGNILEITDSRQARGQALKYKKKLKRNIAKAYHKAYPQHKIDQARLGTLKDKVEQQAILDLDDALQTEYSLRKAAIEDAASKTKIDLLEEVAISSKYKVVRDKKLPGVVYKLEKF